MSDLSMVVIWSFSPIAIDLGFHQIRWYGICWFVSFVLGNYLLTRMLEYRRIENINTSEILAYALIGTILGARLAHCLFYEHEYYLANPLKILIIWEGGLASHGGVLGMLVGLLFSRKHWKSINFISLIDCIAIPAALGGSIIRFANFLNSEIVGLPTYSNWGVVFESFDDVPRHPVQLYESLIYLIVFFILTIIFYKRDKLITGEILGLWLVLTFSSRLIIEKYKEPLGGSEILTLNVGQYLSIPMIIAGLLILNSAYTYQAKPKICQGKLK